MNKAIVTGVFVIAAVALGVWFVQNSDVAPTPAKAAVVVHKSPTCGCCGVYASYLKREGYDVDVHNVDDIGSVKRGFGIPYELESCHTSEVEGYVVEGHVPEKAIAKLLEERPDIAGIGMPGMPAGSPGMPGSQEGPFVIHEIMHDGSVGGVFMTI